MSRAVLPTQYQQFIHLSRYARWDPEEGRRETWDETVYRYFGFFADYLSERHKVDVWKHGAAAIRKAVLSLEVMPSMRAMMTAGRALARDHVAGYNCAYRPIDGVRAFDEVLFILMCGTGVGFSVERQFVNRLPAVSETMERSDTVIVVRDSKRGWAEGLRELIAMLYSGRVPTWDLSRLRPAGARLKTMGGRSSGPGPLDDLFRKVVCVFEGARGRRLTSLECHDLVCMIGDAVVVGGVRRSAMLSLSNLSDQRMRDAKSGNWFGTDPWRALSNNSVAYTEKPDVGAWMREWLALYDSKSGERGVFNREAARRQAVASGRRRGYWGDDETDPIEFGTNPCSEIILRPNQFCNLTEVVARADDTWRTLERKVKHAAALGTWQATLTDFRYLTRAWQANTEEERLLGVSMTGIMDCPLVNGVSPEAREGLRHLREVAVAANREWAERLEIAPATAVTCVKPSGTVSQLVNSSSGIHARHAPLYVRRVRQDMKDPLTLMMIDAGFPGEPDVMKSSHYVFEFPVRAPEGALFVDDVRAVPQLEHWLMFQDEWCEHKPSATIYVGEDEWPSVGAWTWDHFDRMSGVSFLPHAGGHVYRQAPEEAVDEDRIAELEGRMPADFDWSALKKYEENGDAVTATREFACSAGTCEI